MKSTLRIKKINGIEYWDEDIPYYNNEKKQIRHRSKYVGRNVNGKPVRVRDTLNSNEEMPLPSSKPLKAYNYGELLPLQKIINELQIGEYLGDLFNEKERKKMEDLLNPLVFLRGSDPTKNLPETGESNKQPILHTHE